MTFTEILMVGGAAVAIGYVVGSLLMNKTRLPEFIFRKERLRRKLIGDPDLLLEKLKERRHLINNVEITYKIEEIEGVRQIVERETELSQKDCDKLRKDWGMPEAIILKEPTLEEIRHPGDQEQD